MVGVRLHRRRPDLAVVIALSAATLVAFVVLKLGTEASGRETAALDRAVLIWLRARLGGVPGLRAVMLDASALGDWTTLMLVMLAAAGWLALSGRWRSGVFLLAQSSLGAAAVHALKPWFGRARPEVVAHWASYNGLSFPSGHSADAAIVWLSLAVIAARAAPTRALRVYAAAVAVLLVVLVGFSRMFLGVHWPSDVVAGWAIGAAWAGLSGVVERRWIAAGGTAVRTGIRRQRRAEPR